MARLQGGDLRERVPGSLPESLGLGLGDRMLRYCEVKEQMPCGCEVRCDLDRPWVQPRYPQECSPLCDFLVQLASRRLKILSQVLNERAENLGICPTLRNGLGATQGLPIHGPWRDLHD